MEETSFERYMREQGHCAECNSKSCKNKGTEKDTALSALPKERLLEIAREQQRSAQSEQQRNHDAQCLRDIEAARAKRRAVDVNAMRERLNEAGKDYP